MDAVSVVAVKVTGMTTRTACDLRARPVPFALDRRAAPDYLLTNTSPDTLEWLRADIIGPGVLVIDPPARLAPGESRRICVYAREGARRTRVQLSWLHEGIPFLWGFSL